MHNIKCLLYNFFCLQTEELGC